MSRRIRFLRFLPLLPLALVLACTPRAASAPASSVPPVNGGDPAAADPLGPRPTLGEPAPFTPPVPLVYKRPNGTEVWLLERHALPIVSMQLVVPAGAAHDPDGKGGVAWTTANMLDEGAGSRGPLELSRDIDRLGATLRTGAQADYAFVHLTALKKNLEPASEIFADVVTKPRFDAVEWRRIHDLWENALRSRQSEPEAVAGVVVARKVYSPSHPYAHPLDGTLASAARVSLEDVKKLYHARWRSDRARLIVVGDVNRGELDALLDRSFGGWKAPPIPAPVEATSPPAPLSGRGEIVKPGRRVFIVDRADAPQSVIAVARPGVSAFDEESAALPRVNAALGGSFTSRLNQDLREEHGWSYGAGSRFSFTRMRGSFVARAAVHTEHTGEALAAMLADIAAMAKGGLTDEEVEKTKQLARAELVESFETVASAAARLGRNAGVGHSADYEASASHVALRADKATLKRLASQYLDLDTGVIVIVGPRTKIEPQLKAIGISAIETSGPEGQ